MEISNIILEEIDNEGYMEITIHSTDHDYLNIAELKELKSYIENQIKNYENTPGYITKIGKVRDIDTTI